MTIKINCGHCGHEIKHTSATMNCTGITYSSTACTKKICMMCWGTGHFFCEVCANLEHPYYFINYEKLHPEDTEVAPHAAPAHHKQPHRKSKENVRKTSIGNTCCWIFCD